MFWTSIVLVFVTVSATYINYRIYRLHKDPEVIVYSEHDLKRPSIINLIIENVGSGIAKNIEFSSDKPIPNRAFGIDENAPSPKHMTKGPLVVGIPELGPKSKRVITWGQYNGLIKGLGIETLTITVKYSAKKVFFRAPNFQSDFTLDVKSYEGTDASEQNWDKKAAESLERIANIFDIINKQTAEAKDMRNKKNGE